MESLKSTLRKASKLMLWYQFLTRGMYGTLVRYYGTVWLITVCVIAASLAIFSRNHYPMPGKFGPFWVWAIACPLVIASGYLVSRLLSLIPVILLTVALPGLFIITPEIASTQGPSATGVSDISSDAPGIAPFLGTNDFSLFVKGAFISGGLIALSYVLERVAQLFCKVFGLGWMPLRRVTACVFLTMGIIGLEMLRIATGAAPHLHTPWQPLLAAIITEPPWPYAICTWLWLNLAMLLSNYDGRLIPYLLHRTGHTWAPRHLSLHEWYLVDSLLGSLERSANRPRSRHHHRSHDSSGHGYERANGNRL